MSSSFTDQSVVTMVSYLRLLASWFRHQLIPCLVFLVLLATTLQAEPLRKAESLESMLKNTPIDEVAKAIRERGNAQRGAIRFFKSAAACIQCHASGDAPSPLGPNLADLSQTMQADALSDEYLIHSILAPSHDIREAYRTSTILTTDGSVANGIIESETAEMIVLRSTADILKPISIQKSDIESSSFSKQSLMPEGLVASMREPSEFYDLMAYVFEVARGGRERARALTPSADQMAVREDWLNLDHAGIIKSLKSKDFEAGKAIYHGYCVDCHGPDGNRPNLPTARAFGKQPLKFGADPYRMFMTISKGNGLMGPMSHLTPHQRYEVVHYIREAFMKPSNPEYTPAAKDYLEGLPRGTEDGTFVPEVKRDFGPALASQLGRDIESALTIHVGDFTLCYDLHTMNQAGLWKGGFLDLRDTQHALSRGEGTALRQGDEVLGLQGWEWGHDGRFDYPKDDLLPRGPIPSRWMKYGGYYLHDTHVIMRYEIDERPILEMASSDPNSLTLTRQVDIGPGKELVLSVAKIEPTKQTAKFIGVNPVDASAKSAPVAQAVVLVQDKQSPTSPSLAVIGVIGETAGLTWELDSQHRIVLTIPASTTNRTLGFQFAVSPFPNVDDRLANQIRALQGSTPASLALKTDGGATRWPEIQTTQGYLGLEKGAYAVDTLAIPTETPSNTWFRTAALDFLSDGRMVVSLYGGDVWLVSGIDDSLDQLKWKRFAAGLYEPFGVKVVDDRIYVTCKDRIVRLHDLDHNDEADYYENFSDDTDVSTNFHAFNFDLQTDNEGNFYYAKGGHGADFAIPGAVIKISPDGLHREIVCTGFRVPNGMGALPDGRLTVSDNQGQWMPSSKINLVKSGAFYGWVPTYNSQGRWSADGGKIDINKLVPPTSFEEPMLWLPHEVDNSSGGQIWVDDARWGPLSGHLLHTSFGKGWLSYLMLQTVDGVTQAAAIRLPYDFRTGIMRGRVNPKDGQVYVTGLQGWNGGGRPGLLDQGIQRVRYTGRPMMLMTNASVESEGLRLHFNFPLDSDSVKRPEAFVAKHWNYLWQASYGSAMYSPSSKENKVGAETLSLEGIELSDDRQSVLLRYKELQPVDQLHLEIRVAAADGTPFIDEIYWTIHRIPASSRRND